MGMNRSLYHGNEQKSVDAKKLRIRERERDSEFQILTTCCHCFTMFYMFYCFFPAAYATFEFARPKPKLPVVRRSLLDEDVEVSWIEGLHHFLLDCGRTCVHLFYILRGEHTSGGRTRFHMEVPIGRHLP